MPPARKQTYRGLDLAAARSRTVPDVLPAPGQPFHVLFCGINPGLYSAATGHHFARPGNRFWPALHASGFTPRLLAPGEQDLLAGYGLGITNLVARATAQASELSRAELKAGGARLAELAARLQPGTSPSRGLPRTGIRSGAKTPASARKPRRSAPAGYGSCPTPAASMLHGPCLASPRRSVS